MERRRFLLGVTTALSGLAGCSSPLAPRFVPGCDNSDEAVIEVRKVTLSSAVEDEVDLLSYPSLSRGEQNMVLTAIEEDQYRECKDVEGFSDRLYSFEDRVTEHVTEEGHAYMTYKQDTYAIGLVIADQLVSSLPDREVVTEQS